ncbi:MAG TPA: HNH endonuclease signature motif containing protein [Candidatus Krumholzibacteria bacterium]|nr:HNH endonuclease signature motif containing protein [Candidatus Krumholzibacteria bacterium]
MPKVGESQHAVNPTNPTEAVTETYTKISFAAGGAFMAKFRKIQSLAWHRLPANPSVEQVLELAMDGFLEKEDPQERRERREKRQELAAAGASVTKDDRTSGQPPRHIAAAVRDEVYSRDEGRCAFVGSNGRRCSSTQALQMDHIVPVARGGRGTPDNLRLLCAYHNRMEAERLMGAVPMAHARERNRQLPLRQ